MKQKTVKHSKSKDSFRTIFALLTVQVILMMLALTTSTRVVLATSTTSSFYYSMTPFPPYSSGSQIQVTMLNQEPDPAQPGDYVEARFKVENKGLGDISNLYVRIKQEYPFRVISDNPKYLGSFDGMQEGRNGVIIKFRMMIDKNAYPGNVPLKLEYSVNGKDWIEYGDFSIKIESIGTNIGINSVNKEPSVIMPGKQFTLSIGIKNFGDTLVRDVNVELDLLLKTLMTQTNQMTQSIPTSQVLVFSPINSSTQKRIKYLQPGQEEKINFDLLVSPTAKSDVYKLPVIITYYDTNGQKHVITDLVSVVIVGQPKIEVLLEENEEQPLILPGKKTEITLKIINTGLIDSKFMSVEINNEGENVENNDFLLLSNKRDYIGDVDSDDYETTTFKILFKHSGEIKLPVRIHYSDPMGNEYEQTRDIMIRVYSIQEAKSLGLISGNKIIGFLIVIVIAYLGFVLYKKYKKGHKKD